MKEPIPHILVMDDRHATLLALVCISERVLIGGARNANEQRSHAGIGLCQNVINRVGITVWPGSNKAQWHFDIIEEDFALRNSALAHLVQRLAARHAALV